MTSGVISLAELPSLATLKEAAAALRCTARTVQRYIAAGRIQAAKLDTGGSKVLIPRSELERLVRDSMQ